MRHGGGLLIALGAVPALAVAIYNYVSPVAFLAPQTSTTGSPGAVLMVFATAALSAAGLVLGGGTASRGLIGFLMIGCFFGILGTGVAAWLLESNITLVLMAVCAVGWLGLAVEGRRDHA